jgi:hypothetical protein
VARSSLVPLILIAFVEKSCFGGLPQHKLAHMNPVRNTGHLGRKGATSCSVKHPNGCKFFGKKAVSVLAKTPVASLQPSPSYIPL